MLLRETRRRPVAIDMLGGSHRLAQRPPTPPDPAKTAAIQAGYNKQAAQQQYELGATDQITPGGSLTYKQVGTWPDGTPKYEATQSLNAQNQATYNSLMGAAGTAAGNINDPIAQPNLQTSLDTSGVPTMPTSLDTSGLSALPTSGDYSQDRQRVEDALYSRLNPQLAASRASREQDLFNRGVRPGTAAYDRAMGLVGQQENDARIQTVLAGGQEQSRMFNDALAGRTEGYNEALQGGLFGMQANDQGFNQALQKGSFGNSALQQQFSNQITARQEPINEISSLLSGSQINQPSYVNTPQPGVAGVDYAGLADNQYQQQLAQRQNTIGGLFGLGRAALGLFA